MSLLTWLLLPLLLASQEPSVDKLIQQLRTDRLEDREQAEWELKLRGDDAVRAITPLVEDPDKEVAARAKSIVEAIDALRGLTPALLTAIPKARHRLATNNPHAWTELLLEAAEQSGTKRRHPGIDRQDLLPLARRAVRAAEKAEWARVAGAIAAWQLHPAAPELNRFLDTTDWEVRRVVFEAIESCPAPELAGPLLDRMRSAPDHEKSWYLHALAQAGYREALPDVVSNILRLQQPSPDGFIEKLPRLDAMEAVPALVRLLQQGSSWHVVLPALRKIAPEEILPALLDGLDHDTPQVRASCLSLLTQQYPAPAALPRLRQLADAPAPETRALAIRGLANLRRRDLLPEIRRRLDDPAVVVRRAAAEVLSTFGDRSGLPELLLMLNRPETRPVALGALQRVGGRDAVPDLLRLLGDPEARVQAANTLAQLRLPEVRPTLLEMAKDANPEIRSSGLWGLGCLDGPKAIPSLLAALDDSDHNIRSNTAPQMLNYLKAREAVPKFLARARSSDPHSRTSGFWYLTSLAPDQAVPVLIEALEDAKGFVRSSAIDHLGRMKRSETAPLLRVLLRDPDIHVRRASATALAWMGDRSGVSFILRSPSHPGTRFELNRLRRPEVCQRWATRILKGPDLTGSVREVLEEVAQRAGIVLEHSPDLVWNSYLMDVPIDGRDLLTVLSGVLWSTGGAVVEEGRLRVLAPHEGEPFWIRWWAGESPEEGRPFLAELEASEKRRETWKNERAARPPAAPPTFTPGLKAVPGLEARLSKGGDDVWTKVFSDACHPYAHEEFKGLASEDFDVLAPRALRGAMTPAEKVQILQGVAYRRLRSVLEQLEPLLRDAGPEVRVTAAKALLAIKGATALPQIYPLLRDKDPSVRSGTVSALGEAGRLEAVPEILALRADAAIQNGLLSAAGDLRMKEAIPILLEAAGRPGFDHYRTRQVALQSLNGVGAPGLGKELGAMIRTEFDAYAFMLIFGAIGAWGSREATPDLVWFLDNPGKVGGDALPRAYETLAELGAREAIPDILRKLKLQGATQGAARAAAIMGLKEAIPSLRTLLASENIFVVMEAAKALGQLGDRDSLPALRALLRHKDASIRTGASIGLAMLDDRDSIPRILEISRDKEGGYRDSLTPLLYFGLKDEFVVNLSGGDPRPEMVWAFGADLLPVFLQKLRIGDIHSRRNTLLALGYMPGDTALAAIRGMLQDPYEENRQSAYEMLCRRGEREGVARTLDTFNHRYKALPFQLNAVRTPEVWNRLKEKRLKEPVYASVKDLLGLIANEAGLALELPAGDIPERATWEKRYQRLQTWGRRMSLLEALEQLSHRHWMPILEKDRIRIVLRGEARGFWTDWSAKENR